ncbi:UNVERIFIED_CONTAM: hypothetical protein GTU68_018780 [Idotea baltica]|nr:hypothetical protein [Idotea baltica]
MCRSHCMARGSSERFGRLCARYLRAIPEVMVIWPLI